MEIERVGQSSARGGPWRKLGMLASPLLGVALVVAVATIGGTAPATPEASPTASPTTAADATEPPIAAGTDPGFPRRILGLRVRSVAATLELRSEGAIDDEVVAVHGYLTVQPNPVNCFRSPPVTTLVDAVACQRDTILTDTPGPVLAWLDGDVEWVAGRGTAHLHPQAFPGTSLVDVEAFAVLPPPRPSASTDGEPLAIRSVPVALLGRFGDPRLADPRANARHADTGFVVERIVWAEGAWQDRPAVRFLPEHDGDLTPEAVREATSEAVPSGTVALGHAMLDLDLLSRIDPEAAGRTREVAAGGAEPSRVWYVRVMTRDGLPVDTLAGDTVPRRVGWVVLAPDGSPLARRTGS
jgi:hypothetical protein